MLEKLKDGYTLWHRCHELMPKTQRYSLGNRIDKLFIEAIEATATAAFLPPQEKVAWVRLALRKTDVIQVLLLICLETDSFEEKHFVDVSMKLAEIGKDLGGWNGKLTKQNSGG
ncbi:MAG TPA: four helix bundle protein [Candidatus Paceibacterota bacterium]